VAKTNRRKNYVGGGGSIGEGSKKKVLSKMRKQLFTPVEVVPKRECRPGRRRGEVRQRLKVIRILPGGSLGELYPSRDLENR